MACTCYPFGSPEQVREQLVELRKQTADPEVCYAIVDTEIAKAVNKQAQDRRHQLKQEARWAAK